MRLADDSTSIESVACGDGAFDPSNMHLIRIDHVSLNAGDRAASLAWYAEVPACARTTPTTNPVLVESSSEWEAVQRAGIEVAYDGLEVVL